MTSGTTTRIVQVNVVGDASGFNKTSAEAGDEAESTGSRMKTAFAGAFSAISTASQGAFSPLMQAFDGVGASLEGLGEKSVSFSEKMIGLGGGMAAAGVGLTAFASKDKASQQQLAQSIENTGGSYADYKDKIDDAVKSATKFGYTSDETQDALAKMVTVTGSTSKGLSNMTEVENLAAASHESLTSAASQYAMMLTNGTGRALTQFGITTADVTAKVAASNGTMTKGQAAAALLANAIQGQASAASDTFKGKIAELKATVENTVSELGEKFGPALTATGAGMSVVGSLVTAGTAILGHFTQATKESGDAAKAAGAAQEALAGKDAMADVAEDANAASLALETTAQDAEDAALAVGDGLELASVAPILAIIAAVALLGVGVFELATHWSQVWGEMSSLAKTTWHDIDSGFVQPVEGFFEAVPNFVKAHWQLLLAILLGPVGIAALGIKDHIDDIEQWFGDGVRDIEGVWGKFTGFFSTVGGRLEADGRDMFTWIPDVFKAAVNEVIGLWNQLHFTIPGFSVLGHHVGGETIGVPSIPYLASGGIATGPAQVMIGDGGQDEAVIPLPNNWQQNGMGGVGGGQDITIEVPVYLDSTQIGKSVAPHVRNTLLKNQKNYTGGKLT